MKLLSRLKLSPRLARELHFRVLRLGYRFTDLDAESPPLEERVVEYSFAISRLAGRQRGKVLDVGCTDSGNIVSVCLAWMDWEVYGIDLRELKFKHPNFHFTQGDIRNMPFPDNFFDCVCAISTLEHVGVTGRYSVTREEVEGDIKVVSEIARILRPGGTLLVTVPYGKGQLIKPIEKVYDKSGLQQLFRSWRVESGLYYIRDTNEYLISVPEEQAAQKDQLRGGRALALLELTPLK